jgi:hypothetical protein
MGRAQGSYGRGAQTLPKRKPKTRNELEDLREENKQLRELVAHLSELILTRITDAVEPGEQSARAEYSRPEVC